MWADYCLQGAPLGVRDGSFPTRKIISSLKRRQKAACQWFHRPVSDPAIIKDYKEKIKYPMDLSSISSK